jgi:hypothetical protein
MNDSPTSVVEPVLLDVLPVLDVLDVPDVPDGE